MSDPPHTTSESSSDEHERPWERAGHGDRLDRALESLLARRLRAELGYVPLRWKGRAMAFLRREAAAQNTSLRALTEALRHGDRDLIDRWVGAITVGHTTFFRHPDQLRRIQARMERQTTTRIWSAGCATGEEAWSLAWLADQCGAHVDIIATDIDQVALTHAAAGIYERASTAQGWTHDFPSPFRASPALRRRVRFRRGSIARAKDVAALGTFDIVLCRNVLIYFSADALERVTSHLVQALRPGGWLVLAPVEALVAKPAALQHAQPLGMLAMKRPMQPEEEPTTIPSAARSAPPPRPDGCMRAAAQALGRGAWDEAEAHLRRVLDEDVNHPEAWFLLGETLRRRGEPRQARAAYQQAKRSAEARSDRHGIARAAGALADKSALPDELH